MRRRWLLVVALLLGLGGAGVPLVEHVGAHAIVDAPNRARQVPAPVDGELRIAVGPPAATLALAMWSRPGRRRA